MDLLSKSDEEIFKIDECNLGMLPDKCLAEAFSNSGSPSGDENISSREAGINRVAAHRIYSAINGNAGGWCCGFFYILPQVR